MIEYTTSIDGLTPEQLVGFFVGWPDPPSPDMHLRVLRGSQAVALAGKDATGQVVGFATALTDGVLTAYIPLLEVLPAYQRRGIGTALARLVLERLQGLYMVDLMCDAALAPFYARLGMTPAHGMTIRRYALQSGRSR
jgi:ribosomal protein S18 acetylase RimI-like enzyme